ncbi:hypothetical protein [Streptomyces liliifuscus]
MNDNADGRGNATMAIATPAAPDRQRQVEEELVQPSSRHSRTPRIRGSKS